MAMPVVYTETLKECSQDREENLNVNIEKLTANHIVRLRRAFFLLLWLWSHYFTLAGLELITQTRLVLNSQRPASPVCMQEPMPVCVEARRWHECLLQLSPTLCFKMLCWSVNSRDPALRLHTQVATPLVLWTHGIRTQILLLSWWAFCQLSYSPDS